MSDLIDRQAAIDAIEKAKTARTEDGEIYVAKINAEMNIGLLPSVQEQRWIPVTERLPEKKTEVIYSLENHFVSTGYMTDRNYNGEEVELHWEDVESGALIYPEAWMPLPEPYKEGK